MANVVRVKVADIRPKYHDLREWMEDEDNVYIGRAGIVFVDTEDGKRRWPPQASPFANPFKIGGSLDREQCIEKYEEWVREKMKDPKFNDELRKLKGKTLGCWCKPERCHGDILAKIIDEEL